jgi:uncharacterized protein
MDPKTYKLIAVVGVSDNADKYGYKIFRDMLKAGYPAEGVNPKGGVVLGRRIYKSLAELGTKPDLVITVVPPAVTETIVEECHNLGIKTLWLQPGSASPKALAKAGEYGINAISACFMVKEGIW